MRETMSQASESAHAVQREPLSRPRAEGKFVTVAGKKLWIKGVRYRPSASDGHDLASFVAAGINTVAISHEFASRAWLDTALAHGLYVIVVLPEESPATPAPAAGGKSAEIENIARSTARALARHAALLGYAIHGGGTSDGRPRSVERQVERAFEAIKQEDSGALVICIVGDAPVPRSFACVDVVAVDLRPHSRGEFETTLARSQVIAAGCPLIVNLFAVADDVTRGDVESVPTDWPVRSSFAEGCAGVVVGAHAWQRDASAAFSELPLPAAFPLPRISVIVCSYNGSRTIHETLDALRALDYPDFEILVIDDGSTDATPHIAAEHDVRVISTGNRGLSAARNTGWQAAAGEIVAYIDDDAYPEPHWLKYLAYRFSTGDYAAVGGPCAAPPTNHVLTECIANAGGPMPELIGARDASHLPGVNMTFRRRALEGIGGFDPAFRSACDDVDVCLRLRETGGRLGFHAGAMVWHHSRSSLRSYWRQQAGYGRAQALLWKMRRLRSSPDAIPSPDPVGRDAGLSFMARLKALPLRPAWMKLIAALAALSMLGLLWPPLAWLLLPLALAIGATLAKAGWRSFNAYRHTRYWLGTFERARRIALTTLVLVIEPVARAYGRAVFLIGRGAG